MKQQRKNNYKNSNKEKHRINENIKIPQVRLVGDNIENSGNVIETYYAKKLAKDMNLDLVEISPNAKPPVVKILDYKKFLFEEKKRKKDLEKNAKLNNKDIKEIRFGININQNDVDIKSKKIEELIKSGHKVKMSLKYNNRELYIKDAKERGELLLLKIAETMSEISKVIEMPKLNGKQMIMMISPKKVK